MLTKKAICREEDLYSFGLELDLTIDEITQMRTNNPHQIEMAAFNMTCDWWENCHEHVQCKLQKIQCGLESVEKMGVAQEIGLTRYFTFL